MALETLCELVVLAGAVGRPLMVGGEGQSLHGGGEGGID